jgi:hypothetical protein
MIYYVVDAEKVKAVNKIGCGDILGQCFFIYILRIMM